MTYHTIFFSSCHSFIINLIKSTMGLLVEITEAQGRAFPNTKKCHFWILRRAFVVTQLRGESELTLFSFSS